MRPRARLLAGAATVLLLLVLALGAAGAKKGKAGRGQAKGKGQGRGDGSSGAADVADVYDHWCGAALVEKGTGQVDAAVQRLGAAVAQLPNVSAGWLELGAMLGSLGDVPLAQRCLRSAARLDSRDSSARALLHQLRQRGPLPPITPSLELNADASDAAAEHQSRYKRKLYERYYMLDCRMKRLSQLLHARPRDVGALLAAADVSGELLYHRQSVDLLQRALEAEPSNGAIFVRLVEAQVKGCVFANWDSNFQRLAAYVLQVRLRLRSPCLRMCCLAACALPGA